MPTTPGVTVNFKLEDIAGANNAGTLTFTLVNFGDVPPLISGTAMLASISVTAQAAADGTGSLTLFGNYQISPSGTFYQVSTTSADGKPIIVAAYEFLTGGTFDLTTVTPLNNQGGLSRLTPTVTKVSHQWLDSFSLTSGFTQSQVDFVDLSGAIASSQIPAPSSTTFGGIKSKVAVSHNFVTGLGTDGILTVAQPSYSDITGTPQLPITKSAVTSNWIRSYDSTTGLFTASQPAFTDFTGTASTAQIPNLDASKITTGQIALARGGTGSDLSGTGGTSQVLKQVTLGGVITVGQLAFSDLTGSVAASQLPNPSSSTLGGVQSAAAQSHKWINSISTSGVPSLTQPAAADLSDGTTGSGLVVLGTSPTLTTPVLGVATATTINKVTITAPATGSTLTIADGKTLTLSNTLTLAGTDSTTLTFQGTGTVVNRDSTDTLTNKTLDTAGTGNVFKINSHAVSGFTGSGTQIALAVNPTLSGASLTGTPFISGGASFQGGTSGATTLTPIAVASGALTLPSATDTLIGKATTDTLTNKTIDTSGTGNHIQIAGVDLPTSIGSSGQFLKNSGGALVFASGGGGGASAFGDLTGATVPFTTALPNIKYVTGITNITATGNTDLYTVPANKRAFIINLSAFANNGNTTTVMPMIKISATYYRLLTGTAISNNNSGTRVPNPMYIAEAGEVFAVNTDQQPINVNICVVEFDNTANVKTAKLTSFAASTNTLYTVATGKTALLSGSFSPNSAVTNMIGYSNQSGGSVNITCHVVASGGSPGSTNAISGTVTASNNSVASPIGFAMTLHDGDFVNVTSNSSTAGQLAWVTAIEI